MIPPFRAAPHAPASLPDGPFVLLEDRLTRDGAARLYSRPSAIVRCGDPDGLDAAFAAIDAGLADGLHAAGFIAYELGYCLEPRLRRHLPSARQVPLLWFGLFPPPRRLSGIEADGLFAPLPPPPPITDVAPGHDRAGHVDRIRQLLAWIGAGDIYQANLTFPMRFRYDGDPAALYAALRAAQPVAHGALVSAANFTALSVSPELFLRIDGDRAESRPMKGTVARGADPAADERARARLRGDAKQLAENLMIVDLLRNDLSRIARAGSVATPAVFAVETYPTFHTMTSTITARIDGGVGLRARLQALFPCGSIVGAPKIRAAEILAGLEGEARGIYTGAIGSIAPGGDLSLNVAIRTAVVTPDGAGTYGVGGGIVADSDPEAEYDEALLKARALTGLAEDYRLIETLRWRVSSGYVRLDAHLRRLAASARALGFDHDRAAIERHLAEEAGRWRSPRDGRVRLLLGRDGGTSVTFEAVTPQPDPACLFVARTRLDAADPFVRHKTTRRAVYDAAFAEAAAAGCDEALILNRHGLVADASRNSIFVEVAGRLVTPPSSDGALPGVLRRSLIEAGEVAVGQVTIDMVAGAGRLLIGNSLHGLRAVTTPLVFPAAGDGPTRP